MRKLSSVLCLVCLLMLSGCQPVVAPEPASAPAAEIAETSVAETTQEVADTGTEQLYEDPEGRFTVPVPTNWTAETRDGYSVLLSPDGDFQVTILVVEGDDLEAAIAESWLVVDPNFDLPVFKVSNLPTRGGLDAFIEVTYDIDFDIKGFVLAFARSYEDTIYVTLYHGPLEVRQQRDAQLGTIHTGLTITAIEQIDLTGVEPRPLTDELLAELEAFIQAQLENLAIPGAAVVVVQGDDIVYANGFGVRALDSDEPVTAETLLPLGPIVRSMTSLLLATVVDDGLVDWDTPVQEVLSGFRVADEELSRQITMYHLVCACSGVPSRNWEFFFNWDEFAAEDIIEGLQAFEFFTDFGETFQYSHHMMAAGGYAAAAAGGEYGNLRDAYMQEMEARILGPIGMTSSTFAFDEVLAGDYASPHTRGAGGVYDQLTLAAEHATIPVAPAAGGWTNALDMGRYLITQLNDGIAPDGVRVVSPENLALLRQPQIQVNAQLDYSLGWFVEDYKGITVYRDNATLLAYSAGWAFVPEAGIAIGSLTNTDIGWEFNQAVRTRLLELVYEQAPEAEATVNVAVENIRQWIDEYFEELAEVEADAAVQLVGRYHNEKLGEIEVRHEDGRLLLDAGEFVVEVRAKVDADGAFQWYEVYGPLFGGVPITAGETDDGRMELVWGRGEWAYPFTLVE